MAQQIRGGVVISQKETPGEFKARQTAKRIKRRGLSTREKKALSRAGVSKEQFVRNLEAVAGPKIRTEQLGRKKVAVSVKRPDIFVATFSSGRTLTGTRADIARRLAMRQSQLRKLQKSRRPLTLIGGTPSGTVVSGVISDAKRPIPQRRDVVKVERSFTAPDLVSKGADPKKFFELRRKGLSKPVALREAKKFQKKKVEAIKKVERVNNIIDQNNKRYDKFVNNQLRKIGIQGKSFSAKVTQKVVSKASKFLNPIIVGTEIGAALDNVKTLKDAGVINIPRSIANAFTVASLKKLPRLTKNLINSLKKNLNPNTVQGLSNLLTIAIILRADKLAIKGTKKIANSIRALAKNPKTTRVVKTALLSPLGVIAAAGGKAGGRRAIKTVKAPKGLGKALKKGARESLRSQRRAAQFRPKEVKGFKITKDLKLKPIIDKVPKKLSPQRKSPIVRRIARQQRRTLRRLKSALKEGRGFAIKDGSVKATGFSSKSQAKNVLSKSFNKNIQGNQITLSKVLRRTANKTKQLSKAALSKETKKGGGIRQIYRRTANVVYKDLRPEKLFKDLIIAETQVTRGGFRKGVKEKLFSSLRKQALNLARERSKKFKSFIKSVNNFSVNSIPVRFRNTQRFIGLLKNYPKLDELLKLKFSDATARKINNFLRGVSLLNVQIALFNGLADIVKATPVSSVKSSVLEDLTISGVSKVSKPRSRVKTKVRKKRVSKPVRRPKSKTKPVSRVVARKPAKKPKKRVVARPKRKVRPRPRLPKFFRKKSGVVRVAKRLLRRVPEIYRPSLVSIIFNLRGKKPENISGAEIRRIVDEEFKKKKKKVDAKLKSKKKKVNKKKK